MQSIKSVATAREPSVQRLRLAKENGGFILLNGELVRVVCLEERPNGWIVADIEPADYIEGLSDVR